MRNLVPMLTLAAVAALAAAMAGCTTGAGHGAPDRDDAATDRSSGGAPSDAVDGAKDQVKESDAVAGDPRPTTLQPEAAAAVNDFATTEGIAPGSVTVVAVTPVTWPDSGLGCPSPGEMYTQALVPGYEVRLSAGDRTAIYHTNRGLSGAIAVRRCGNGAVAAFGNQPVVLDQIRADLAKRVPADTTPVLDRSGPAAATSLVCPGTPDAPADPGALTLQMAVSEVVLRIGADQHVYRIWNGTFVYCGIAPLVEPPGFGTPTVATSL